jgi:hypothetical protein
LSLSLSCIKYFTAEDLAASIFKLRQPHLESKFVYFSNSLSLGNVKYCEFLCVMIRTDFNLKTYINFVFICTFLVVIHFVRNNDKIVLEHKVYFKSVLQYL